MPIRPLPCLILLLGLASVAQAQEAPSEAEPGDTSAAAEAPDISDAPEEDGGGADTGTAPVTPAAPESAPAEAADPSCFGREMLLTRAHYTQPAAPEHAWTDIYLFDMGAEPDRQALRLTRGALDQSPYDNGPAAWAAEGTRILFHSTRGAGVNASLYAMDAADADADGLGDGLLYLGADDPELGGPETGPEGRVIFARTGREGQIQVHVAELSEGAESLGEPRQVSRGEGLRRAPRFSPDGSRAIYQLETLSAQGPGRSALAVLTLETGEEQVLSPEGVRDSDPAFLNAEEVVFARQSGEAAADLWRATLTGDGLADPVPLTETPELIESRPVPSPDGACLAWLATDTRLTPGPATDLVIRDLGSGETRTVTATRDIAGMAWRP
ncbi:hypothetical protein E0K89_010805 [Aquicoccus sp. SCR17]|nr:hypothetical protein [Carideicomes alvinocaridis]